VALYNERGVVLRTHPLGETDRIITFMTAGRGRSRAVAKGIRRTTSRFGSRLEPGSHVAMQCWEGRSLDGVNQVEVVAAHRACREDLQRLTIASVMLEAVDCVAIDGQADMALFRLLAKALDSLESHPSPALLAGFLWKLQALEGFSPGLYECIDCGTAVDDTAWFDIGGGGVRCHACRARGGRPVEYDALLLIRAILGGQLGTALNVQSGPAVAAAEALAVSHFEFHAEKRLRSISVAGEVI